MTTAQPDSVPDPPGWLSPTDRENVPTIERHLLAACLRADSDDPGIDDAAELVGPDDFAMPAHALTFAAAVECRRERSVVLLADVYDRLRKFAARDPSLAGSFREMQPNPGVWLAGLWELEATGANARHYASLVREASIFRRLRGVAAEIAKCATLPTGSAADVLGECERLLFDLTDAGRVDPERVWDAKSLMSAAAERADERQASGAKLGGSSIGFPDLDDLLGGLRPGQLVVVGARPGGGKTAFSLSVAAKVVLAGEGVLFLSMEMPADQIADRLLAMGSGVPMSKLTRGQSLTPAEVERLARAAGPEWVGGTALYVDDAPDQPAQRVAAKLRRAVRRQGVSLAVVDYLQLVRPENPRENRTQQVGLAARRMKQAARECGVPVILLCQLNRQVEQRGGDRPRLSDLRESGEIEQHADMVLLLHTRPDQTPEQPVWLVDVIVAKNRNGPVGEVPLAYRRAVMTFENHAKEFRTGAA
jgi:replicative DNA helicase